MQPPNAVEAAKTLTPFNYANYAETPDYRRGHGHRRFPLQEFPRLFVPAPKKKTCFIPANEEGGRWGRGGEGEGGWGSGGEGEPRGKKGRG